MIDFSSKVFALQKQLILIVFTSVRSARWFSVPIDERRRWRHRGLKKHSLQVAVFHTIMRSMFPSGRVALESAQNGHKGSFSTSHWSFLANGCVQYSHQFSLISIDSGSPLQM